MENYAVLSLETNLFFPRIMKEHALFLEAGFVCVDTAWIERADWFRGQFEDLLRDAVRLGDGRVNRKIVDSEELVTEFTIPAERRTEHLSGVSIDSSISRKELKLRPGWQTTEGGELVRAVDKLNRKYKQKLGYLLDKDFNIIILNMFEKKKN